MQCTDVACHYSLMMLHVAWSMCVSVCVLGTRVSCAKTAEAIELPFGGGLFRVDSRNHVLDGVQMPHEKGILWDVCLPIVMYL